MRQIGRTVLVLGLLVLLLGGAVQASNLVGGVVVWEDGSHVVIATSLGFTVGEIYRGLFYEQKQVLGEFHHFGFTDVYDRTGRECGRVYVDDYLLDETDVLDWLRDNT